MRNRPNKGNITNQSRLNIFVLLSVSIFIRITSALDNGVARTPPMGWSTFNQWGGAWDANLVKLAADSIVSTGLRDCGYVYVNCDGHNDGNTPYWPSKKGFVEWATPIVDYLKAKQLKFGVYMTTVDNPTAAATDMVTVGVEYLKHDDWGKTNCHEIFTRVRDALLATKRPIVYSTNSCLNADICNMARTGADIGAVWSSIITNFDANYFHLSKCKPGFWADADMMQVGCREFADGLKLTYDESRSHFSLWCIIMSPLIIGFDVTRTHVYNAAPLPEFVQTIAILSNTELIAINQDTSSGPAQRIKGQGTLEVWVKKLKDGSKAVVFLNRTSSAANMTISQAELGWPDASQIYVRDLWLHDNLPPFSGTFTKNVKTHATEVFRMSDKPISNYVEILRKMDRSIAWLARHGCELFPQRIIPKVIENVAPYPLFFDTRGRVLAIDRRASADAIFNVVAKNGMAVKMLWHASIDR